MLVILRELMLTVFAAALFVPMDDLSFLKCDDKTKSLTTASALPSLINSIND
jgi:hypothetical protein